MSADHYWLGYLTTTVALSTQAPDPKPLLKQALTGLLKDYPAGTPIGDSMRTHMKGRA